MMRVQWVSALLGHMSQTILGYVTFLVLKDTSSFGMKYIVLVTSILLLTPWAKRPNSLARYFFHISLSGPLMRWINYCNTPVTGFSTAFASKLLIYLAALAYRALLTSGCCWLGWRNGYWWVLGALLGGIFSLRGSSIGASCWWFLFSTIGGVGAYGGVLCTLFSDWFGGCGVKLSCSGVSVMGDIFTLCNVGATLVGGPGGCVDYSVGTFCCGWTIAC